MPPVHAIDQGGSPYRKIKPTEKHRRFPNSFDRTRSSKIIENLRHLNEKLSLFVDSVSRSLVLSRRKGDPDPDTIEVDRGREETGPGIGRKQNFTRVLLLFWLFFFLFLPFAFGESKRRLCALPGESNGSRS